MEPEGLAPENVNGIMETVTWASGFQRDRCKGDLIVGASSLEHQVPRPSASCASRSQHSGAEGRCRLAEAAIVVFS